MNNQSGSKPSSSKKISSPSHSKQFLVDDAQDKQSQLLEHLELTFFKIQPCNNPNSHNHKQCKYYHGPKDRRRLHTEYSSELCEYNRLTFLEQKKLYFQFLLIENEKPCQFGEDCQKSHNKVEQLYSVDKYKTKFCTLYPNNCYNCDYGSYCSFAHTESDIQVELIHNYDYDEDFYIFYYKTIWCPFNFMQHDRGQCPQLFKYESVPCQYWKPEDFIIKYEDGCVNQSQCGKCHGWKEYEYHPLNYRTKPCSSGNNCSKGQACPYYHNQSERRVLPINIQSKLFRYAPRNRVLKNTYKVMNNLTPQDQIQNEKQMQNIKRGSGQSIFSNISYLSMDRLTTAEQNEQRRTELRKIQADSNDKSDSDDGDNENFSSSNTGNDQQQGFGPQNTNMKSSQKRHSLYPVVLKDNETTEMMKQAQKRMSITQNNNTGIFGIFQNKQQKPKKNLLSTSSQSYQPSQYLQKSDQIEQIEEKKQEQLRSKDTSISDEDPYNDRFVTSMVDNILE